MSEQAFSACRPHKAGAHQRCLSSLETSLNCFFVQLPPQTLLGGSGIRWLISSTCSSAAGFALRQSPDASLQLRGQRTLSHGPGRATLTGRPQERLPHPIGMGNRQGVFLFGLVCRKKQLASDCLVHALSVYSTGTAESGCSGGVISRFRQYRVCPIFEGQLPEPELI